MARARGRSLGTAVHALLQAVPDYSTEQELKYVTGLRTGASKESVARQLGVTRGTLNRWLSGKTAPRRGNQVKIKTLFTRFWILNHRVGAFRGDEMLKISSAPGAASGTDGIRVKGKPRDHLILEQGAVPRDWGRLSAASTREINTDQGKLFIDAAMVDIPYVTLGAGSYTIETL